MDPTANNNVRAFVAVELPSDVKAALARLVEVLGEAGIPGLRPVRPEGIHLTLKFLGDVPSNRVGHISDVLARVCREHGPLTLKLGCAGVFSTGGSPRVLWVGVEGEIEYLRNLQLQVEASLVPLGFTAERREFSPHLTVARVRDGTPSRDRRRAADLLLAAWAPPDPVVPVNELTLMRSTLLPGGAVYDRLASAPLAGHSLGEE